MSLENTSDFNYYSIVVDVPLIGERSVFTYRSPYLLAPGDLVVVPLGKGDTPHHGIVLGKAEGSFEHLKAVDRILKKSLFPSWYIRFVMDISQTLIVPPFNIFRISYSQKLMDISNVRILLHTGNSCHSTKSPHLNVLLEELVENGFLIWREVKKRFGSKTGRLWKRLKELGCGIEEIAPLKYEDQISSFPWVICSDKEYPLGMALVTFGRKQLQHMLSVGSCEIVFVAPSAAQVSDHSTLKTIKGDIHSLVDVLKHVRGKTLILVRNRNVAIGMAKKLVKVGFSKVISPSMGSKEILSMIVSDTDGLFVLPTGYLFKPWNSLSNVVMYDVDDVKIPLRDGGMIWLPATVPVVKRYISNVFYISPFPSVGIAHLSDEIQDHLNLDQLEIVSHHEENIIPPFIITDIRNAINKGGKVLVYAGRLGYRTAILCKDCGYVQKCPTCGMTMVFHIRHNHAVCHRCGYVDRPMETCPKCGSKNIAMVGTGIELIEQHLKEHFGDLVEVVSSTNRKKPSPKKPILLSTFRFYRYFYEQSFDLVYIPDIDFMWSLPSYTIWEDTLRMLYRIVTVGGRIIVSTRIPKMWNTRIQEQFFSFVSREIGERKLLSFPPFNPIVYMEYGLEDFDEIMKKIDDYYSFLESLEIGDVWKPEFVGRYSDGLYRWSIRVSIGHDIPFKLLEFIEKTSPLRYFLLPL